MPIRPENKNRYPANWKQIRERMLERAQHKCEWCGVKDRVMGYRKANGDFVELCESEAEGRYIDGEDVIRIKLMCIVLTTAHVNDRNPENCADDNLAILCQRCHLNHDRGVNLQSRLANEKARQDADGQMFLFETRPLAVR